MVAIIKAIMDKVNNFHDKLQTLVSSLNLGWDDKHLHFVVIGVIGIVIFAITQLIFRWISKYSITALSFIYTFTVLLVIVFAIEIEQKITKRGNMEFGDITAGLIGFIYFFIAYSIVRIIHYLIKNNKKGSRRKKSK